MYYLIRILYYNSGEANFTPKANLPPPQEVEVNTRQSHRHIYFPGPFSESNLDCLELAPSALDTNPTWKKKDSCRQTQRGQGQARLLAASLHGYQIAFVEKPVAHPL